MVISDGGMAIDAYFRMRASSDSPATADIRKGLRKYCGRELTQYLAILKGI